MPKATLTFDLPEEKFEHDAAVQALQWMSAMREMDGFLRRTLKYGHAFKDADEALEKTREELWRLLNDEGLNFNE